MRERGPLGFSGAFSSGSRGLWRRQCEQPHRRLQRALLIGPQQLDKNRTAQPCVSWAGTAHAAQVNAQTPSLHPGGRILSHTLTKKV